MQIQFKKLPSRLLIHDYKLTGQKRALTNKKVARHQIRNKKSLNITRTV